MKKLLAVAVAMAVSAPVSSETVAEIIDAGIAMSEAYKTSQRSAAEAAERAQEDKMYWTCSCVGGNPVWGYKSLRMLRAENGGKAQRSQVLFESHPQMSLQLNTPLSTLCK